MVEPKTGRQLDEDLWVFDRPFSVFGLKIGTRMTVVRLGDGSLFLHSPVEPDAETRADLDALGPVRFVVAPNKVHHLFVGAYRDAYPQAELWAAPGLPEKRRDIAFHHVLDDDAPAPWAGEIYQLCVRGLPYVNEVVFLHRRTRTLLLTDLGMNFAPPLSLITRFWIRLNGLHRGFAVSRLMRTLLRDPAATRASVDRMLAWDFERVIVTHGVVLPRSGKRLVRESWDRVL